MVDTYWRPIIAIIEYRTIGEIQQLIERYQCLYYAVVSLFKMQHGRLAHRSSIIVYCLVNWQQWERYRHLLELSLFIYALHPMFLQRCRSNNTYVYSQYMSYSNFSDREMFTNALDLFLDDCLEILRNPNHFNITSRYQQFNNQGFVRCLQFNHCVSYGEGNKQALNELHDYVKGELLSALYTCVDVATEGSSSPDYIGRYFRPYTGFSSVQDITAMILTTNTVRDSLIYNIYKLLVIMYHQSYSMPMIYILEELYELRKDRPLSLDAMHMIDKGIMYCLRSFAMFKRVLSNTDNIQSNYIEMVYYSYAYVGYCCLYYTPLYDDVRFKLPLVDFSEKLYCNTWLNSAEEMAKCMEAAYLEHIESTHNNDYLENTVCHEGILIHYVTNTMTLQRLHDWRLLMWNRICKMSNYVDDIVFQKPSIEWRMLLWKYVNAAITSASALNVTGETIAVECMIGQIIYLNIMISAYDSTESTEERMKIEDKFTFCQTLHTRWVELSNIDCRMVDTKGKIVKRLVRVECDLIRLQLLQIFLQAHITMLSERVSYTDFRQNIVDRCKLIVKDLQYSCRFQRIQKYIRKHLEKLLEEEEDSKEFAEKSEYEYDNLDMLQLHVFFIIKVLEIALIKMESLRMLKYPRFLPECFMFMPDMYQHDICAVLDELEEHCMLVYGMHYSFRVHLVDKISLEYDTDSVCESWLYTDSTSFEPMESMMYLQEKTTNSLLNTTYAFVDVYESIWLKDVQRVRSDSQQKLPIIF